jgi:hypothetical protein
LLAELALELEHRPSRAGVGFGAGGVECAAAAEHGFLNLIGDDRPDFPEILSDVLDLDCSAEEKFEVAFEIAGGLAGLGGVEALADEVEDIDLVVLLSMRR